MSCASENDTCGTSSCGGDSRSKDWLFLSTSAIVAIAFVLYFVAPDLPYVHHFSHAVVELLKTMWWGIVLGILSIGVMHNTPREWFQASLGRGDKATDLFRAAFAGLFLDVCSHGILMVAAKLYERGISAAQVMTFLIASPWNSLTLTFVLAALVGWFWTLMFILGSAVIALITGFIYKSLVERGVLPENPNQVDVPEDYDLKKEVGTRLKSINWRPGLLADIARQGLVESRMVLRWLFLGLILAAAIKAYIPTEFLTTYFGPGLLGLVLTLVATTIIEVCSEGSAPIASELVGRAGAPGNGFTFLMAGVATDYTEILVLRETTKSWKLTLFLPLITIPQVLLLGAIMNMAAG